ncbi:MAG: methionyl-tRNA formyltransferase [Planctomycetia bacterium]|nr:methionyl-tRNA formyltransferase [Planctomycetia bacterium]
MKILIMGTGGFILPSLDALLHSDHDICALITMPLRVDEHSKRVSIPPVHLAARRYGILPYVPEDVNSEEGLEILDFFRPDLIFICDYGKILSSELVQFAKYGGINLHGSILPKYRGAAPINRALLAGEEVLGVSVIQLDPKVDAGPILGADSWNPSVQDTAVEIEQHLSELGVPLVLKAIDDIEKNNIVPLEQDPALVCGAPRLKKADGWIDWTKPSRYIINQYRALQPWPKVFSDWIPASGKPPKRLILGPFAESDIDLPAHLSNLPPGSVLSTSDGQIIVQTGDYPVEILMVQSSGKNRITAGAFLRGNPLRVGDRFGRVESRP